MNLARKHRFTLGSIDLSPYFLSRIKVDLHNKILSVWMFEPESQADSANMAAQKWIDSIKHSPVDLELKFFDDKGDVVKCMEFNFLSLVGDGFEMSYSSSEPVERNLVIAFSMYKYVPVGQKGD